MSTLKQLKEKLWAEFKDRSKFPPEIQEVYEDLAIVKFQELDPITGESSSEYAYIICDQNTGKILDTTSYESFEICQRVAHTGAWNNPKRIQEIVDAYNNFHHMEGKS